MDDTDTKGKKTVTEMTDNEIDQVSGGSSNDHNRSIKRSSSASKRGNSSAFKNSDDSFNPTPRTQYT